MKKFPPIPPVGATGPLGITELPRLWAKVLLQERGLLPDDYTVLEKSGLDRVVLTGLGLDGERVREYLAREMPIYPEFEKWILKEKGGKLDPGAVKKVNETILNFEASDARRKEFLDENGLPDDGTIRKTHILNTLDDWFQFHRHLTEE